MIRDGITWQSIGSKPDDGLSAYWRGTVHLQTLLTRKAQLHETEPCTSHGEGYMTDAVCLTGDVETRDAFTVRVDSL